MPDQDFRTLEYDGWMAKAGVYDDGFARVTQQAVPAILDSFGELGNARLLDVCCGTGHLSAAGAKRGARVEGVDFAGNMIRKASRNYPALTFREADAGDLPYPDACFDAVACAFGIHHLQAPETAVREVHRVLRPGGCYTLTTWAAPAQGQAFMGALHSALEQYGNPDADIPAAPAIPVFEPEHDSHPLLSAGGFGVCRIRLLPLQWRASCAEDAVDLIYASLVRVPMLLAAQPAAERERVQEAFITNLRSYEANGSIEVPFAAVMVSAVKPAG